MVLMAKEIVEDLCDGVTHKARCVQILYRIITRGEGIERLSELSEDDRVVIEENLKGFGMRWKRET